MTKHTTIGNLLKEGKNLVPIQNGPQSNCRWGVGFYHEGLPHKAFKETYNSYEECLEKCEQLAKKYNQAT
jgi:hypothetical protein